jgi:hypothetical protein
MNTNSKFLLFILITVFFFVSLNAKEISPRTAFLRSALIPGWGEISQGNNSGYFLLATEVLLWSSIFYFNEEEDLLLKESYNYAIRYAHIDPQSDFDNDFLYHLSRYNSSGYEAGGYNAYIIEQAETIEDPLEKQEFIENNIYSDALFWEWDSKENRRQYGIKRKDSSHFNDYAKAVTGVIIANHIVSAINSIRINRKNRLDVKVSFNGKFDPVLLLNYQF